MSSKRAHESSSPSSPPSPPPTTAERAEDGARVAKVVRTKKTTTIVEETTETTMADADAAQPPPTTGVPVAEGARRVDPPCMTGRSHIEVTVTAHLIEVLFGTEGATLEALWAALRRGVTPTTTLRRSAGRRAGGPNT